MLKAKSEEEKKAADVSARYLLILISAILEKFFYIALLPLTVYPVYFLLSIFFPVSVIGNLIQYPGKVIEIAKVCVGSSAVLLFLLLNLSTPQISIKKRIKVFLFCLLSFLLFNWIRIVILSILYIKDYIAFDSIHAFFWYAGSTIFVFFIWLASIKAFGIKGIALLDDLNYFLSKSRLLR